MNIQEIVNSGKSLNGNIIKRGGGNSKYSISIIYSNKNGKRIVFSKGLLNELGNPKEIQFVINAAESCLLIGENLLPDESKYTFTKEDFNILYCGNACREIVETFELDYSDGKTSQTFNNIDFDTINDSPVAVVKFN